MENTNTPITPTNSAPANAKKFDWLANKRMHYLSALTVLSLLLSSSLCFNFDYLELALPAPSSSQAIDPLLLAAWVLSDLAGFVVGLYAAQIARLPRRERAIVWSAGILLILSISVVYLVLQVTMASSAGIYLYFRIVGLLSFVINEAFFGFVFGITLSHSLQPYKLEQRISWPSFLRWFAGASSIGLIGCFLLARASTFITVYGHRFSVPVPAYIGVFIFYYCSLIGITEGHGDKIIKQIKMRYKYFKKEEETHALYSIKQTAIENLHVIEKAGPQERYLLDQRNYQPRINWKRSGYGLIIGFLYGLPLGFLPFFFQSQNPIDGELIIGDIVFGFAGAIEFGLIIACIYGFGPIIYSYVENAPDRRLGRMGIVLAVAGTILVAYFH